jgi:hypothetical protein
MVSTLLKSCDMRPTLPWTAHGESVEAISVLEIMAVRVRTEPSPHFFQGIVAWPMSMVSAKKSMN